MKIQQLSLFLENKPGHLHALCQRLADAGINIVTLSLADTQQFGIVRLIVHEWEKARDMLENAGYIVNVREVVAATVPDKPGGLAEILSILHDARINIEYMYAFAFRHGTQAILVFRFDDPDQALTALRAAGRDMLQTVDIFS